MFEGTKHEKALITVLAFIIGITSGFIAFGISPHDAKKTKYTSDTVSQALVTDDTVLQADPDFLNSGDTLVTEAAVVYADGYLLYRTPEGDLVLSAHLDNLNGEVPEILSLQGHHVSEPFYSESLDGEYLYFCEQQDTNSECINFVFDKNEVAIRYAKVADEKLITPTSMAANAYWATEGLHVGDYVSESVFTPWLLTEKAELFN